mgnify:CR=1 FL=1
MNLARHLKINIDRQQVIITLEDSTSKEIDLKRNEFKLLLKLVRSPDKIFSRDSLLDEIISSGEEKIDRNIDTYISRIRKKIKKRSRVVTIQQIRK